MKYYVILLLCVLLALGGCNRSRATEEASAEEAQTNTVSETATPDDEASDIDETDTDETDSEEGDEEDTEDANTKDGTSSTPLNSPLNSPLTSPLAMPSAIEIETSATTGAVSGQIIAQTTEGDYIPVAGYTMGLATLVPRSDGDGDMAAAYDPSSSPTTKTNESGQFVFNDMEPGRYGLILDAVVNQALLSYPDGADEGRGSLLIEVEADQHLDLGVLQYDSLPIHGFTD